MQERAIILGDSFNNTLGLIRSLGECGTKIILVLVGDDRLCVSKSKYLDDVIPCKSLDECEDVLKELATKYAGSYLICTNDKAAKWVDDREEYLSPVFLTPMRGGRIGPLFDKAAQCRMAEEFGINIPKSIVYKRGDKLPDNILYPLLLKPANSNAGEKSDIHICSSQAEFEKALNQDSNCDRFICQEYVEKDYEINMIGVSTDAGVLIPGGIRKIRHYPTIYSPCSFGKFLSVEELGIDTAPLEKFITTVGYKGPFSIEFIRKGNKDYFMEINFRHDGLAYAATKAGVNLLDMYVRKQIDSFRLRPTYMMDLSIDYCHVKDGSITKWQWLKDFLRTRCQLNFNMRDYRPTMSYYLNKFKRN